MAETLPHGTVIPKQDEPISAAGVAEMRTLGASVDARLGAKADTTYVDAQNAAQTPLLLSRGGAPAGTDFSSWLDAERNGLWAFSAGGAAGMTGLPPGFGDKPGSLLHLGQASRVSTQIYIPYAAYSTTLLTRQVDNVANRTWTDWAPLGAGSIAPMTQHAIRQNQMVQAIGPVDTGGLGAVAIRCDHGFTNFRDKVLPAVKARGIKVAMAYNPRNWHYAENAGVTAADLNGWVAAGDVEIMNHSANHLGADARPDLYDQIVNGLAEIEAELPAARGQVWGFAPPGVSTGDYGGFDGGRGPEGWDTYAGQLILQHHAVGTGYLPGTSRRVLDGQIRDGLGHVTIDGRAVADIKADIDDAIASKRGLQLMLHPSTLDTTGKLSTAQLVEVLDYIVTKRDAGEIKALSPYQMLLADATRGPKDSGDLDITGSLAGVSSGRVLLTRIGQQVWLDFQDVVLTAPGSNVSWNGAVPSGYRPPRAFTDVQLQGRASVDTAGPVRISSAGQMVVYKPSGTIRGLVSWFTREASPA